MCRTADVEATDRSRCIATISGRLRRYPLQNLDPDKFVSTLEEIGGLSPYASFKVDDNNKTLFVLAPDVGSQENRRPCSAISMVPAAISK